MVWQSQPTKVRHALRAQAFRLVRITTNYARKSQNGITSPNWPRVAVPSTEPVLGGTPPASQPNILLRELWPQCFCDSNSRKGCLAKYESLPSSWREKRLVRCLIVASLRTPSVACTGRELTPAPPLLLEHRWLSRCRNKFLSCRAAL